MANTCESVFKDRNGRQAKVIDITPEPKGNGDWKTVWPFVFVVNIIPRSIAEGATRGRRNYCFQLGKPPIPLGETRALNKERV